ncbi:peptidase inhibitor family I36 protein [Amycolatopsis lurida]
MRAVKFGFAISTLTLGMTMVPVAAAAAASFVPEGQVSPLARQTRYYCENIPGIGYCVDARPSGLIPCPSGRICLYTDENFRGMQVSWPKGNYHPDFDHIPCPDGYCRNSTGTGEHDFNDEVSSWANNATGITYCVSYGRNGGNPDTAMPSGLQDNVIAEGWHDVISSLSTSGC